MESIPWYRGTLVPCSYVRVVDDHNTIRLLVSEINRPISAMWM